MFFCCFFFSPLVSPSSPILNFAVAKISKPTQSLSLKGGCLSVNPPCPVQRSLSPAVCVGVLWAHHQDFQGLKSTLFSCDACSLPSAQIFPPLDSSNTSIYFNLVLVPFIYWVPDSIQQQKRLYLCSCVQQGLNNLFLTYDYDDSSFRWKLLHLAYKSGFWKQEPCKSTCLFILMCNPYTNPILLSSLNIATNNKYSAPFPPNMLSC